MTDERLPRECRIRRSADFDRIYKRRRSASDGRIVVYGCENEFPFCRLGLSVSSRVGPAVVRNRWKRLLREAFRIHRHGMPRGIDFVVVARVGNTPELSWIAASLVRLGEKVAKRLAADPR